MTASLASRDDHALYIRKISKNTTAPGVPLDADMCVCPYKYVQRRDEESGLFIFSFQLHLCSAFYTVPYKPLYNRWVTRSTTNPSTQFHPLVYKVEVLPYSSTCSQ